jgi:hypothetical protein
MAPKAFSRCPELSVRNSAKSSETLPHANVELSSSNGGTRFDFDGQSTAGRPLPRVIWDFSRQSAAAIRPKQRQFGLSDAPTSPGLAVAPLLPIG